jgi:aldose 1-epimerase
MKTDSGHIELVQISDPASGLYASICTHGARLLEWVVERNHLPAVDVVLGYQNAQQMLAGSASLGAIMGRFANRIANSSFSIGNETFHVPPNHGVHCLHGGQGGLRHQVFEVTDRQPHQVTLSKVLRTEDDGFPGRLEVDVTYTLNAGALSLNLQAKVHDHPTVVNLTAHPFFNLNPQGDWRDHQVELPLEWVLPVDSTGIPFGSPVLVEETDFDFRTERAIGGAIEKLHSSSAGFDHCWLKNSPPDLGNITTMARFRNDMARLLLEIKSDAPGILFFSGHTLTAHIGKFEQAYGPFSGFCFEPQDPPDAPNQSWAPSTVLLPDQSWSRHIEYVIHRS